MTHFSKRTRGTRSGSLLVRILRSPKLEIVLGLFMLLIGLIEVVEDAFLVALPSPEIHHAILLLGGITAFRGLIDVFEGLERFMDGEIEIKSHKDAKGESQPVQGD